MGIIWPGEENDIGLQTSREVEYSGCCQAYNRNSHCESVKKTRRLYLIAELMALFLCHGNEKGNAVPNPQPLAENISSW